MIKKCIIFLFLATAYFIFQAHNFIAHHHDIEVSSTHHHDHEDNDHEDSPFNDLTHTAEFGKIVVKPHTMKLADEETIAASKSFVNLFNKLIVFNTSIEYHPPDDDFPLHLIFLSHSLPLRAPPAC
jgi:hypothetical protein